MTVDGVTSNKKRNTVNARIQMYAVTSSMMNSLTSAAAAAVAMATCILIVQLSPTAAYNIST